APLGKTRFPTAAQLGIPRPAAPDPAAIDEIAERLASAREPVIVAGCGRNPAEGPGRIELGGLAGIPVVQGARHASESFAMNHPLFAGKRSIADADVVVTIEAEVPWVPTGPNAPSPDAFVAAIGVDPVRHRIPTYEFTADLRVTSDALAGIRALTAALRRRASAGDRAIPARPRPRPQPPPP